MTVGELCDNHRKKVAQGGKDPFYVTVVEPLLDEIEYRTGLKGSFDTEGSIDVKARARFQIGDIISQPLLIDYTGEAPDGGPSLMIWIDSRGVPEKFRSQVVNHLAGPLFVIPRSWTAADFSQIVQFDD